MSDIVVVEVHRDQRPFVDWLEMFHQQLAQKCHCNFHVEDHDVLPNDRMSMILMFDI